MKIEIFNEEGEVENTIVADADFAEQFYAGLWREVSEQEPTTVDPAELRQRS